MTTRPATGSGAPVGFYCGAHGSQDRNWSGVEAQRAVPVSRRDGAHSPRRGRAGSPNQAGRPMTRGSPGSRPAYPGEALGLPESGPGSLAPMGRRAVALLIDWLISYGLAGLALGLGVISKEMLATSVLVLWFVLGVLAVRLFGFTPGQLVLGLGVVGLDGRLGVGRLVVRGLLVGLVIPPLFTDWDGRGLQDRVTGTAVVRR